MASPTLQTADTKNGTVTGGSGSATWTFTYPTNIAAGNLLFAAMSISGTGANSTPTFPSGWIVSTFNDASSTLAVAKKLALGTETGTFNVTLPATQKGGWRVYRITGWGGDPNTGIGTVFNNTSVSGDVVVSSAATGTSTTPNPPNLDPGPWATEDVLWIAASSSYGNVTYSTSTIPTGYSNASSDSAAATNGGALGLASKTATSVTSEDPGTFSTSASAPWVSVTVGIAGITGAVVATPDAPVASSGSTFTPSIKTVLNVGNVALANSIAIAPVTGVTPTVATSNGTGVEYTPTLKIVLTSSNAGLASANNSTIPPDLIIFPFVVTADTKNGVVTSNNTTWTLTYPTNLVSGDLIIATVATDGITTSPTWPSGWIPTSSTDTGSNITLHVAKKRAVGTETGNFTLNVGANEQGGWRVFRITQWGSKIGSTFDTSSTSGNVLVTFANDLGTTSLNPDPPALTLTATYDVMWIAAVAVDTSRTVSVWPTNYINTSTDNSGGPNGSTLASGFLTSISNTEDPTTFTISTADNWVAATIGIYNDGSAVFNLDNAASASGSGFSPQTSRIVGNVAAANGSAYTPVAARVQSSQAISNGSAFTPTIALGAKINVENAANANGSGFNNIIGTIQTGQGTANATALTPSFVISTPSSVAAANATAFDVSYSLTLTFDYAQTSGNAFAPDIRTSADNIVRVSNTASADATTFNPNLIITQVYLQNLSISSTLNTQFARITKKFINYSLSLIPVVTLFITRAVVFNLSNLLNTTSVKNVQKILNTVPTFNNAFSKLINNTVNLGATFNSATQKLTSKFINFIETFSPNIALQKFFRRSLNINLSATVSVLTRSQRLISLSILNAWQVTQTQIASIFASLAIPHLLDGGDQSNNINYFLDGGDQAAAGSEIFDGLNETLEYISSSVQKRPIKLIIQSFNNSANITNILIRAVSLAILSSFSVIFGNRFIQKFINSVVTANNSFIKYISTNITSTFNLTSIILWFTGIGDHYFSQNLEVAQGFLASTIKLNTKNLTLSQQLNLSFQRLSARYIAYISTLTAVFQNKIGKFINASTAITVTFVTRSARFITFAVVSSFTASRNVIVNKTVQASNTFTAVFLRKVNKTVSSGMTLTAVMLRYIYKVLSASLINTLTLNTKTLKLVAANLNTTNNFIRQINKYVLFTYTLTASISRLAARWVSLAVIDSFGAVTSKLTSKTISYSIIDTVVFRNQIGKFINSTINITVNLITKLVKLISLSIISSFTSSRNVVVNKFIIFSESFNNLIQRSSTRAMSLSYSLSVNKLSNTLKQIISTSSNTVLFNRISNKLLNSNLTNTVFFARQTFKLINATLNTTLNILKVTYHLVSMALIDSFNAVFTRNPIKSVAASFSNSVVYQFKTSKFINSSISYSVNFVRESSKGVYLSIVSAFTISRSIVVNKFIVLSTTFSSLIQRSLTKAISLSSSLTANRLSNTLKSVTASSLNTVSFNKISNKLINATLTDTLLFTKKTFKSISSTLTATVNIVRLASHLVSMALVDSFSVAFVKVSNKLLLTSLSSTVSYQLRTTKFIQAVETITATLTRQSLRLISFNIISSFTSTRSVNVSKSIALTQSLTSIIQKQINHLITVTLSFNLLIIKQISKIFNVGLNTTLSFVKVSNKSISISLSNSATFTRKTIKNITLTITETVTLLRLAARLIALAVVESFSATYVRVNNKFISASINNTIQSLKFIRKIIDSTSILTINLSTRSLRLITFNVLSTFSTSYNKISSKFFALTSSATLTSTRVINKFIINNLTSIVNISTVALNNVSLSIQSYFSPITRNNVIKPLNIILQRYFFGNTITGGSSTTTSFDDSIDASSGNNIIEGNPISSTLLNKNIGKFTDITSGFATNLALFKNTVMSLAIISSFNVTFNKFINKFVSVANNNIININKIIPILLQNIISFTTELIPLFVRPAQYFDQTLSVIVTLSTNSLSNILKPISVTSTASNTLQIRTFKLINQLSTFNINFAKSIFKFINASISNSSLLIKNTYKVITLGILYSSTFVRQIVKLINYATNFVASIATRVARLVSLTTIDSFNVSFSRVSNKIVNASIVENINYQKFINKFINNVLNASVTVATRLMKLVSISIVSGFTTARNVVVAKFITSQGAWGIINLKLTNKSLSNTITMAPNIIRYSFKSISIGLTNTISYSRFVYHNITLSLSLTASIARLALRQVSLALINSFTSTVTRLSNKIINYQSILTSSYQKIIFKTVSLTLTYTATITKQSLRFVSLALVSGFSAVRSVIVNRIVTSSALLTASIQRASTRTVSVVTTITASQNKLIAKSISLIDSYIVATNRTSIKFINAQYNLSTSFARSVLKNIISGSTLVINISRIAARWISLAIISSFASTLSRTTNKSVSIVLNGSLGIRNSVIKLISLTSSQVSNITTQSLRFISFSLLPSFTTSRQVLIGKTNSVSITINSTYKRFVYTSLNLAALIGIQYQKFIFKNVIANITVAATTTFETFKRKLLEVTSNLNVINGIAIIKFINNNPSFTSVFRNQINIYKNIAINFNSNINKQIQLLFNANINNLVNFTKLTIKNINLIINNTTLINRQIQKIVQLTSTFSANFTRLAARWVSLALLNNFATSSTRTVDKFINLNINNDLNYQKLILKNFVSSINFAINFVTEASKIIRLAVVSGFNINYNLGINKTIENFATFTTEIFQLTARWISMAILSNFKTTSFNAINKFISINFENIINNQKLIVKNIILNINVLAEFVEKFAKTVLIAVLPDFNVQYNFNVSTTLQLIQNFASTIEKTVVNILKINLTLDISIVQNIFKNITNIFDISINIQRINFKNINSNFETFLNINRQVIFTINNSITFIFNITTLAARWVSLAVIDSFNASFIKITGKTIETSLENLINYQKQIQKSILANINAISTIALQLLRLVSLNILSSFTTSRSVIVSKSVDFSNTLLATFQRQTYRSIILIQTFNNQFIRTINKLILTNINNTTSFTKSIYKFIDSSINLISINVMRISIILNSIFTLTSSIANISFRFITLAVVSLFKSERLTNSTIYIQTNIILTLTIQKLIQFSLNVINQFTLNVQKFILAIRSTLLDTLFTINSGIAKLILIDSNFISSILQSSLRIINLSVINIFNVNKNNYIIKNINISINIFSSFNRIFEQLLEVTSTLLVRRAHILYSAFTAFAVNKSQPGSEGSAQEMQRKAGGSTRKRNINNNSSTLFRRGNTDDLE